MSLEAVGHCHAAGLESQRRRRNEKNKRILAVFLAVVMLFSITGTAMAEEVRQRRGDADCGRNSTGDPGLLKSASPAPPASQAGEGTRSSAAGIGAA